MQYNAPNIQILDYLNAGIVDVDAFSQYVCAIQGTEHYNDDVRQLRGSFGFSATDVLGTQLLPTIGTSAKAFVSNISNGGAADNNLGGTLALTTAFANFDGGEIDGEELWVLFGMGIDITLPETGLAVAPGLGSVPSTLAEAVDKVLRSISLEMFSNGRDLPLGAVADWPSPRGARYSALINGAVDCGVRTFRPIALKPSTKFNVKATICARYPLTLTADGPLGSFVFTVSFTAWRMNIRETFGNAQCQNLFN